MKDETAEYKGKVYQIGRYYLFSDDGRYWNYNMLKSIDVASEFPFVNVLGVRYSLIKEVHASKDLGTITPAPIKLIDGSAYMFDTASQDNCQGYYAQGRIYYSGGWSRVANCANIRRMLVELDP